MKSFIQEGTRMTWTNSTGSDVQSGQPVHVGNITGVAVGIIKNGETGELARCGVFEFKKDSPLAISQGDNVFWNTTDKEVTKTATDKYLGVAFAAAGSSETIVCVEIADAGGEINKAANVAFTAGTNLTGVDGTGSNAAPLAGTETRLDAAETAISAILTALKNADLMATS